MGYYPSAKPLFTSGSGTCQLAQQPPQEPADSTDLTMFHMEQVQERGVTIQNSFSAVSSADLEKCHKMAKGQ